MTQEQKDLLLKDLCSRLPYGVKCNVGDDKPYTLSGIDIDDKNGHLLDFKEKKDGLNMQVYISEVKPYLFPLSSMTEEQLKEMQEIIGNPNEACISVNTSGLELWLNSVDTDPTIWLDTIFEVQDWLNRNHFDYRGLIKKGLAIDATNLNIYSFNPNKINDYMDFFN